MFDVESFNLTELNHVEVKEKYQVEVSSKFTALKNWDDNMDISRALDSIRGNIKVRSESTLL
jgi:hypothetical protein